MRLARALIATLLLPAAAPAAAGTAAGSATLLAPTAAEGFSLSRGHVATGGSASMLRGLRQLQSGTVPDGTVLLGDPPPVPLASGVSVTLAVTDVNADGIEDLVRIRGTITKPKLAVTDAGGAPLWERSMSTYAFAVRIVPDGPRKDLLVFISGTMQRLDGDTGTQLWSVGLPSGDSVGYFGVSPGPNGGDVLLGAWSIPQPQITQLQLFFRSMASGNVTGSLTLQGEGDYPSAALAGDLDADGVGDIFTLTPIYTFSAASGGILEAVGTRGATEIWSTPFAVEVTDFSWVVDGSDVTGDGKGDAVMFSEWLGVSGSTRTTDIVSVVNGNGGTTAGMQPVRRITLEHFPDDLVAAGDLNADGGKDLIFSGPVYNASQSAGKVVFEAVGRGGRLWRSEASYGTSFSDFRWGWWPQAGDLDGDGIEDALALVGDTMGPQRAVGISQRGGATLWTRDALAGGFVAPLFANANGSGGDDVVDRFAGSHPSSSTTKFEFTVADGRDLAPLWAHTRVVDSGYPQWTIYFNGGHIDPASGEDVVVEYVMGGAGRHFAETLHGPTGAVKWSTA